MLLGQARIRDAAPEYTSGLKAFVMDTACNIRRHAEAKLRNLTTGQPGYDFYEWLVGCTRGSFERSAPPPHSPRTYACCSETRAPHRSAG